MVLLKGHYTLVNYTHTCTHISTGHQTSNYKALSPHDGKLRPTFQAADFPRTTSLFRLCLWQLIPDYCQQTYEYTSPEEACSFTGYKKCPLICSKTCHLIHLWCSFPAFYNKPTSQCPMLTHHVSMVPHSGGSAPVLCLRFRAVSKMHKARAAKHSMLIKFKKPHNRI